MTMASSSFNVSTPSTSTCIDDLKDVDMKDHTDPDKKAHPHCGLKVKIPDIENKDPDMKSKDPDIKSKDHDMKDHTDTDLKDPKDVDLKDRPSSPDSTCPICLCTMDNRCFTDSCFHQFCFNCLVEWSKVKAECPLCKQTFRSIIHTVLSMQDYQQYVVPPPPPREEDGPRGLMAALRTFAYRTTVVNHEGHGHGGALRVVFQSRSDLPRVSWQHEAIPWHSRWHSRYSYREPHPQHMQRTPMEQRRDIYASDLWVRPLMDVNGRYRETSPEFYRANPTCLHRLVPWLHREVSTLMSHAPSRIAFVVDLTTDLMSRYLIRSAEFREMLQPFLGLNTDHFIHELYHFARSPYDMFGYDRHAQYEDRSRRPQIVQDSATSSSSSSSSETDSDIIIVDDKTGKLIRPSNQPIDLSQPGPSGLSQSWKCDVVRRPQSPEQVNVWSSSDSDECVVVDVKKPKRERTPEIITLSSDDEPFPVTPAAPLPIKKRKRNATFDDMRKHVEERRSRRHRGKKGRGKKSSRSRTPTLHTPSPPYRSRSSRNRSPTPPIAPPATLSPLYSHEHRPPSPPYFPGIDFSQVSSPFSPPQSPPIALTYHPPTPPLYHFTSPDYMPSSPDYRPISPAYAPSPPSYIPSSPMFPPPSPIDYMPLSPTYRPSPPSFRPSSPNYGPLSPVSSDYSPLHPMPPKIRIRLMERHRSPTPGPSCSRRSPSPPQRSDKKRHSLKKKYKVRKGPAQLYAFHESSSDDEQQSETKIDVSLLPEKTSRIRICSVVTRPNRPPQQPPDDIALPPRKRSSHRKKSSKHTHE